MTPDTQLLVFGCMFVILPTLFILHDYLENLENKGEVLNRLSNLFLGLFFVSLSLGAIIIAGFEGNTGFSIMTAVKTLTIFIIGPIVSLPIGLYLIIISIIGLSQERVIIVDDRGNQFSIIKYK